MEDLDTIEDAREEYRWYLVSGMNASGEYFMMIRIRKNGLKIKLHMGAGEQ